MRTKRALSLGEWAVLALLSERPMHGYAVAATMAKDGEVGAIWSLGQPLTYRALTVLQTLELVEVSGETPGDRAPRRTELRATERGRELLESWLAAPAQRPRDLRSELLLKVALLRRRGDSLAPLLRAQHDVLIERMSELEGEQAAASGTRVDVVRMRWLTADAGLRFVDELLEREGKG
ncbi:MAG TPA: PadR family transcriptional regulator [Conexibacter sp.]